MSLVLWERDVALHLALVLAGIGDGDGRSRVRGQMLKTFREGQLVTVASEGGALDGVVAHIAQPGEGRSRRRGGRYGSDIRTAHPKSLTPRDEPGPSDDALRRLIHRGGAAGHQAPGGASARGRRAILAAPRIAPQVARSSSPVAGDDGGADDAAEQSGQECAWPDQFGWLRCRRARRRSPEWGCVRSTTS